MIEQLPSLNNEVIAMAAFNKFIKITVDKDGRAKPTDVFDRSINWNDVAPVGDNYILEWVTVTNFVYKSTPIGYRDPAGGYVFIDPNAYKSEDTYGTVKVTKV